MNEILKRWSDAARAFFSGLSTGKKVLIGVFIGLLAVAGGIAALVSKHNPYALLYTDLTPQDSVAMAAKLGELNIPHRVSLDHKSLSVPVENLDAARMELAKAGLPGEDVVGFERFDSATFGMSSYVQRVQYIRALQGELVRSIQRLDAVKRARVHISIPPKKTFLEEQESPKASVVLELRRGKQLHPTEAKGIAHLVASAVEGLTVEQTTIVDTNGKFLHRPEEEAQEVISTKALEMQRSIEKAYEKRIVDLLSPVVGAGKIVAKVSTEIDTSRSATTEETYDPSRTVATNTVKNDEVSNGQRPNPIGIPGSRSNLPGTEVQNPPIPMATTNSEKNSQNTRYAVPKKIERTERPSGAIKRLTVAVVVDGHYRTAPDGKSETFVPRSEEELTRLRDLVATAVGYDANRRDGINITSLPMKATEITPLEEDPTSTGFDTQLFLQNLTKNGLIVLVILFFFFTVLRPFLKWAALSDMESELSLLPTTVGELEAAQQNEGILALTQKIPIFEEPEPLEKKEEEELSKRILTRMAEAPKKGVRIIQEWIEQDDPELGDS
ncbi:MAG: flagellar basal-body MS-ring/collar protein FliF [Bdellovibrionota bacterium]